MGHDAMKGFAKLIIASVAIATLLACAAFGQQVDLPVLINECSNSYLSVTIKDQTDTVVVPDSLTYWVHDQGSGELLYQNACPTNCDPWPDSTIEITLPPAANRIVNRNRDKEVHVVTVSILYASTQWNQEPLTYAVENNPYVGTCSGGPTPVATTTPTITPTVTRTPTITRTPTPTSA